MSSNSKKRTNALAGLAIVLILTIVIGAIGFGVLNKDGRWMPTANKDNWPSDLELGLDLQGGIYVEYTAEANPEDERSAEYQLDLTMRIIQNRLTDKGLPEATVQKVGTSGIRVEIPIDKTLSAEEQEAKKQKAVSLIGTTAKLTFVAPGGYGYQADENGSIVLNEDGSVAYVIDPSAILLDGSHVKLAYAEQDSQTSAWGIGVQLDGVGAELFAAATEKYVGQQIAIFMDNKLLMAPTVNEVIPNGSCRISGSYTQETASEMAVQIQSGALPMTLTLDKQDSVSATLGPEALSTSVMAAMIGILLVMAIMLFRYRLNGLIACWALVIYIIVLFLLIAKIPGIQLTLPGLAGIVLGIGMAVDANVIIFERFNEEVRAGRGVKQAARAGFKNALSAILDGNVTTIIAAVVLLIFGTGSVQGFAKTLLLGVITSLFTAVLVTRFLMNRIVDAGYTKPSLYCKVAKIEKEAE